MNTSPSVSQMSSPGIQVTDRSNNHMSNNLNGGNTADPNNTRNTNGSINVSSDSTLPTSIRPYPVSNGIRTNGIKTRNDAQFISVGRHTIQERVLHEHVLQDRSIMHSSLTIPGHVLNNSHEHGVEKNGNSGAVMPTITSPGPV